MPELRFSVQDARRVEHAATPLFALHIAIDNTIPDERISTITLRAQIHIDVSQRLYNAAEQTSLVELFGERGRGGHATPSLLWTHATTTVPAFTSRATFDLPVACTYDFALASTKYFHSLTDGHIPLVVYFAGSIFYDAVGGALAVAPIPSSAAASFRCPLHVWRHTMEQCYFDRAPLLIGKDVFERLNRYRIGRGFADWDDALRGLLREQERQG